MILIWTSFKLNILYTNIFNKNIEAFFIIRISYIKLHEFLSDDVVVLLQTLGVRKGKFISQIYSGLLEISENWFPVLLRQMWLFWKLEIFILATTFKGTQGITDQQ